MLTQQNLNSSYDAICPAHCLKPKLELSHVKSVVFCCILLVFRYKSTNLQCHDINCSVAKFNVNALYLKRFIEMKKAYIVCILNILKGLTSRYTEL